jgi:hypothetical protein
VLRARPCNKSGLRTPKPLRGFAAAAASVNVLFEVLGDISLEYSEVVLRLIADIRLNPTMSD